MLGMWRINHAHLEICLAYIIEPVKACARMKAFVLFSFWLIGGDINKCKASKSKMIVINANKGKNQIAEYICSILLFESLAGVLLLVSGR